MRWDLFCRVIDNYGDIGVCWRLAADLGQRGELVRLWVDDDQVLAWMAPDGASNVEMRHWTPDAIFDEPGDAVVEAFGCDLPSAVVQRMAGRTPSPAWINLEYLSAEPYVERSHGLMSPVLAGPGAGLSKWFYYPGFTAGTGGLLRGPASDPADDVEVRAGPFGAEDQRASVFCYDNPMLGQLAASWPGALMLAKGPAQVLDGPRAWHLPWLTQTAYDRLLRHCELNFVRGEDSFVRAMWAARPFVWQIYPQHDGAHRPKLEAFLDLFLAGQAPGFSAALRQLWRAWNGFDAWPAAWPDAVTWAACCTAWRDRLLTQDDLGTQLQRFVSQRR